MKEFQIVILSLVLATMFTIVKGQDTEIITEKRISSSIAGEGDPWEILSDELEKILIAFHKGYSAFEIAAALEKEESQLINQLEPLIKANLVIKTDSGYLPDILVATEQEASQVYSRAKITADMISETLMSNWHKIENSYGKLDLSKTRSLKELGFMLVGSRILDVGVLRALATNKELLLAAPNRPTPSHPDSKYYLWIEENSPDRFGYGQKDAELKYPNWYVVNFGRDNESRFKLEEKAIELLQSGAYDSSEDFAKLMGATFVNKEDSRIWEDFVNLFSETCLIQLLNEKHEIKELYKTLATSRYSENTLDDFYCWYYHYVYPMAINNLITNDIFDMPPDKHTTVVLFNERGTGVHFE